MLKYTKTLVTIFTLISTTLASAQVVTYYAKKGATTELCLPENYVLENGNAATEAINENVALYYDVINKGKDMIRWDLSYKTTCYSVTSLKSTEIWLKNN